ncbi:unnamed protein product, partial [Heterotrigona itama]
TSSFPSSLLSYRRKQHANRPRLRSRENHVAHRETFVRIAKSRGFLEGTGVDGERGRIEFFGGGVVRNDQSKSKRSLANSGPRLGIYTQACVSDGVKEIRMKEKQETVHTSVTALFSMSFYNFVHGKSKRRGKGAKKKFQQFGICPMNKLGLSLADHPTKNYKLVILTNVKQSKNLNSKFRILTGY